MNKLMAINKFSMDRARPALTSNRQRITKAGQQQRQRQVAAVLKAVDAALHGRTPGDLAKLEGFKASGLGDELRRRLGKK